MCNGPMLLHNKLIPKGVTKPLVRKYIITLDVTQSKTSTGQRACLDQL